MSFPLALWVGAAVTLFWSVGAYNRLVRLRSDAIMAFGALEAAWQRQIELVRGSLPESAEASGLTQPGDLPDRITTVWTGLSGAATQCATSLAAMRLRPLDPRAAAALTEAHDVFSMAWLRVQQEAHDLAGAPMPETLGLQWQHAQMLAGSARQDFNGAVGRYNEAIGQFPALLLAWVFGFKMARQV